MEAGLVLGEKQRPYIAKRRALLRRLLDHPAGELGCRPYEPARGVYSSSR